MVIFAGLAGGGGGGDISSFQVVLIGFLSNVFLPTGCEIQEEALCMMEATGRFLFSLNQTDPPAICRYVSEYPYMYASCSR